jgi:hypothetical protein
MIRTLKLTGLAALSMLLASPGLAGDADTMAMGSIEALDANQGAGTQTNGDFWEDMNNALVGSGTQTASTDGDANTGSGSQDNSYASQDDWSDMYNANSGSGAQVLDSTNSNGGDRTSSDIVLNLGDGASVANSALEASITGNAVTVENGSGSAGSSLHIGDDSGFFNLAGVNAIALSSGHNSSQNISVNVTATIATGISSSSGSTGTADINTN